MPYNNICRRPPMTERPIRPSFTPYETAAPLVLVAVEEDPEVVDEPRVVASAVVLQMKVPWITLPDPASDWKPLQSIWAVD